MHDTLVIIAVILVIILALIVLFLVALAALVYVAMGKDTLIETLEVAGTWILVAVVAAAIALRWIWAHNTGQPFF